MFCARCGTQMQEGARYCSQCGQPQTLDATTDKELQNLQLENARMENSSRKGWSVAGGFVLLFIGASLLFTPIGGIIAVGIMAIVVAIISAKKKK